jgi:hypothetical protein
MNTGVFNESRKIENRAGLLREYFQEEYRRKIGSGI